MLKSALDERTNWRAMMTVVLFAIACFEATMAYTNYQYAKRQANIEALVFTRDNINGFTFLYGQFETHEVYLELTKIRDADLPAVAVPSQYGDRSQWLIITPSFGTFPDSETAIKHILDWRTSIINKRLEDDKKMKFRAELMERYKKRQGLSNSPLSLRKLVLFYKADIINWGEYFRQLALSELFYVNPKDAEAYARPSSRRWGI